ncbi:TlpA disulfide reductase family protein [Myxococcota bacterium]
MFALLVALAGCGSDNGAQCETGPRDGYPAAPFGVKEGSVIDNLQLTNSDDSPFALQDVYADGDNRLLLVSTAAGWCVACIEEQPTLQSLYEEHQADGLFVLVSLYQDAQNQPADAALAAGWKQAYGVSFAVVADPSFLFDAYYDSSLTPMNMLVDVCDMTILKITTGNDPSAIEAIIESRLQ